MKGDPSLTKARVTLKSLMKSWSSSDQGFLVECRVMEGGMSLVELYGVDEVLIVVESIPALLSKIDNVFEWPEELRPRRSIEHHI